MATKKITELTAITTPTGADIFPIVQGGITYRATRAQNASKGADIASAATTDIGAATGKYVEVTGTVTITSFGTVAAGTERIVRFTGALILTHNATSLILPDAVNITTVANDCGIFVSLGSGNWYCVGYKQSVASNAVQETGTSTITASTPASVAYANQRNQQKYCTISGTNTYTGTLAPAITAYVTGMSFDVIITNASTAASTININSVGAKKAYIEVNGVYTQVTAGDIFAGQHASITYDSSLDSAVGGWVVRNRRPAISGVNYQSDTTNSQKTNIVMQSGWGFVTGTGALCASKTVTFPVAYTTVLAVVITAIGYKDSSDPTVITDFSNTTYMAANAEIITTTNFAATCMSTQGTTFANTRRMGFSWIAIGLI